MKITVKIVLVLFVFSLLAFRTEEQRPKPYSSTTRLPKISPQIRVIIPLPPRFPPRFPPFFTKPPRFPPRFSPIFPRPHPPFIPRPLPRLPPRPPPPFYPRPIWG